MHRRAVLSCWQQTWQPLPEPLRERFLARPQVDELASLPDEMVRMSIRAHEKLAVAVAHAHWLRDGRRAPGAGGCEYDDVPESSVHRMTISPGPVTRVGGRSPSSSTVVGRCRCGWQGRAGSELLLWSHWQDHVNGDDERY
jgi:hypothetical protein